MKLNAISVHIGSQILSENPFKKTLKVLEEIIKKTKISFKFVELGGGLGITYKKLGKFNKAEQKFKEGITINSKFCK